MFKFGSTLSHTAVKHLKSVVQLPSDEIGMYKFSRTVYTGHIYDVMLPVYCIYNIYIIIMYI